MNHEASTLIAFSEQDKIFIQQQLNELIQKCTGLLSCVAASVDGFVVCHASLQGVNAERLAAMSSSATAVADAVVGELNYDKTEAIVIDASKGKVVVLSVPCRKQNLVLLCACNPEALLGQVLYNSKNIAGKIAQHI